jgi:hypothetical protein
MNSTDSPASVSITSDVGIETIIASLVEQLTPEQIVDFVKAIDSEAQDMRITRKLAAYFAEQRRVEDGGPDPTEEAVRQWVTATSDIGLRLRNSVSVTEWLALTIEERRLVIAEFTRPTEVLRG